MYNLWLTFQILIGYNLFMPIILYFFYRLMKKQQYQSKSTKEYDYAVIITAYQQTELLPAVVNSALGMQYSNFLIYVVADNCADAVLNFDDERVVLLRPETVLASNTRSHLYAIANFKRPHQLITIIDSDNLIEPNYLNELNVFFSNGFEAVQGLRKPRQLRSTLAALDAARDLYYHFYDAEVMFNIGSSATLAGSGMAFDTALYKRCFEQHDLSGAGFDKVLQAKILLEGKRIAFAPKAVVYDEKTAEQTQLVNQRARWINTWFKYFSLGFNVLFSGIINMDRNKTVFGMMLLRPPLFIFILIGGICLMINLILLNPFWIFWVSGFFCFILAFCIALRQGGANREIYRSLARIPSFILLQLRSLLRIRSANQRSVATRHQH